MQKVEFFLNSKMGVDTYNEKYKNKIRENCGWNIFEVNESFKELDLISHKHSLKRKKNKVNDSENFPINKKVKTQNQFKKNKTKIKNKKCENVLEKCTDFDKADSDSNVLKKQQYEKSSVSNPITRNVVDEVTFNNQERKKHMKRLQSVDCLPIFDRPPLYRQMKKVFKKSYVSTMKNNSILSNCNKTHENVTALSEPINFEKKYEKDFSNVHPATTTASIKYKEKEDKHNNSRNKNNFVSNEDAFKPKQQSKRENFSLLGSFDEFKSDYNHRCPKKWKKDKKRQLNKVKICSSLQKLHASRKKRNYDVSHTSFFANDTNVLCDEFLENSSLSRSTNKHMQNDVIENSTLNELPKMSKIKQNVNNIFCTETCVEFNNAEVNSNNTVIKHVKRHETDKNNFNPIRISTPNNPDFFLKEREFENNMNENHLYSTINCSFFEKSLIHSCKPTFTDKNNKNSLNMSEIPFMLESDLSEEQKKYKINFSSANNNIVCYNSKIHFEKNPESNLNVFKTPIIFDQPNLISKSKKKKYKRNKEKNLMPAENCTVSDCFEKNSDDKFRAKHKMENYNPSEINNHKSLKHEKADIEIHTVEESNKSEINVLKKHRKKYKRDHEFSSVIKNKIHGEKENEYSFEKHILLDKCEINSENKHHKKDRKEKFDSNKLIKLKDLNGSEKCDVVTETHTFGYRTQFVEPEINSDNKQKKKHKKNKKRKNTGGEESVQKNKTKASIKKYPRNDSIFNESKVISESEHKKKSRNFKTADTDNISDCLEDVLTIKIKKNIKKLKEINFNLTELNTSESANYKKTDTQNDSNCLFNDLEATVFDSIEESISESTVKINTSKSSLYAANTSTFFSESDISSGHNGKHKKKEEANYNGTYFDFTKFKISPEKQKSKRHKSKVLCIKENNAKFDEQKFISVYTNSEKENVTFAKQNISVQHRLKQPIRKHCSYTKEENVIFNEHQVSYSDEQKKHQKRNIYGTRTGANSNNVKKVKQTDVIYSDNIESCTTVDKNKIFPDYEGKVKLEQNSNANNFQCISHKKKPIICKNMPYYSGKNENKIMQLTADDKNKNYENHCTSDSVDKYTKQKTIKNVSNCDLSNDAKINALNKHTKEFTVSNNVPENCIFDANKKHVKEKKKCKKMKKHNKNRRNDFNIDEMYENIDSEYEFNKQKSMKIHSVFDSVEEHLISNKKCKKKHKKSKDKHLNSNLPSSYSSTSKSNKNCKEYPESLVLNNAFKTCRINYKLAETQKLVNKKKKKYKQNRNDLLIGEVDEKKKVLSMLKDSCTLNPGSSNHADVELNFAENIKNLTDNELHLSPDNSVKREKQSKILYNNSHSESSSIHDYNDISRKICREYPILHVSNSNVSSDNVCDSGNIETFQSTAYSTICQKNLTDEEYSKNSSEEDGLQSEIFDYAEDPADFEVPPLHKFEKVSNLNQKEKKHLEATGGVIKGGKYTTVENNIIKRNVEDFMKKYNISDPVRLLGIARYKQDSDLLKFLKAKHFYVKLGKDLNDRALSSIYRRARVIFDPYKNANKFTENEILKLKDLHK